MFEDVGFHDFKISVKHHDVITMVETYRLLASKGDWPLHLGANWSAASAFVGDRYNSVGRWCTSEIRAGLSDAAWSARSDRIGTHATKDFPEPVPVATTVSCPACTASSARRWCSHTCSIPRSAPACVTEGLIHPGHGAVRAGRAGML